ncbi:hypothetical protein [Microcoleus sp. AT9b-C3]|uniref:hypothetical protein n=1 Tax=Microcoleus sp. AT9b-C3 TaxID=2818629 RepID=UPI002FD18267
MVIRQQKLVETYCRQYSDAVCQKNIEFTRWECWQQFIQSSGLKLNLPIEPIAPASRDTQHQVKLDF